MSSLRLITKLTTSLLLACTLTSVASAEAVRVPDASVATAPAHFAQPPHQMRVRPPTDADLYVPPAYSRAAVRDALLEARHRNLAFFRAYQKAGVFPSNTYQPNKLNVWRDADGHFCAAATIIRASGMTDLVDRVADQNNFIRLADVSQGPLMDWILTSGFTQDEIAMIQEPFDPVTSPRMAPSEPIIDARLRAAENARLRAKYTQVERALIKNEKRNVERAVDRLMKRPDLAATIVIAAQS